MQINGLITFTSDFGNRDPYAGIMKGMVLNANPQARIVDITHEIPAHNIINAAFTLVRAYQHFPVGTIHVAVVDTGVGGKRKNIAVLTDNYIFIGPDNGIFTLVFSREKPLEIRLIQNAPFIMTEISDTFHGRDIFAPCAGHLSAGKPFSDVGPLLKQAKNIIYPKVKRDRNLLTGEVVAIDSFGNMITNITEQDFLNFAGKRKVYVYFGSERFKKVATRYVDVPQGSPLVLFGSSGYLEISMNEGNAASYFMTSTGSPVTIRKS